MSGVSLGFWTPGAILADPETFATSAQTEMAGADAGFPLRMIPIEGKLGQTACYVASVTGHIPMHNDSKFVGEHTSKIFQFIVATRNRPMMMTMPRNMKNDMAMVNPMNRSTFAAGCFELRAGMVVHFDTAETWHGISALPLSGWSVPEAVIIQVPWPRPHEITNALSIAQHALKGQYGDQIL